jgi:hypothetical protein
MASSCLINFFTKNGKKFETSAGIVIRNISDKRIWEFHPNEIGWIHYIDGVVTDRGKWECDGEENYKIIQTEKNRIYSSRSGEWTPYVNPDTPVQLDPAFSCVTNGLTSMGLSFQIKDNIYVVATLKSGTKWFFYQTKPGVRPWVEVNNKTMSLNGTWSCLGESNFQLTRSDGKTYVGGDTSWKDETQPETTTEPTYDKTNFPLKKGSEGKEVIQLQNYLNKEIPANPLVIDGIFGDLTHNKLVQVQKNKGVL